VLQLWVSHGKGGSHGTAGVQRKGWHRRTFPVPNRSDPILGYTNYEGRFLTIDENYFNPLYFYRRAQESRPILS
jgi:hypothetical protein